MLALMLAAALLPAAAEQAAEEPAPDETVSEAAEPEEQEAEEQGSEEQASPADYPESLAYENLWVADEAGLSVEILRRVDFFDVLIVRAGTDGTRTEWEYITVYDPETGALKADGTGEKTPEEGEGAEGLSAVFFLSDDGTLRWEDEQEDAGAGLAPEKVGLFGGRWSCGDAELRIDRKEGRRYAVRASVGNGAEERAFDVVYDPETNRLESEEGSFAIGEGFLLEWQALDGAADGLAFEKDWDD